MVTTIRKNISAPPKVNAGREKYKESVLVWADPIPNAERKYCIEYAIKSSTMNIRAPRIIDKKARPTTFLPKNL
jgi:hypothetical protein